MNSTLNPSLLSITDLGEPINHLTRHLTALEQQFLKTHTSGKSIKKEDSLKYHDELEIIADRLKIISEYFFQNLTSEANELHKKINEKNTEYQTFFNAEKNLTSLVIQDILSHKKVAQVLLAAERWAFIMKRSFEKNDFITCHAICLAFSHYAIANDRINIIKRLSNKAQEFLTYFQSIFMRPSILDGIQSEKAAKNELVIPSLTALHHQLEIAKSKFAGEFVEREKRRYSAIYENMQQILSLNSHSFNLYPLDLSIILPVLMKRPNETLFDDCAEITKKMQKGKCKFKSTENLTKNMLLHAECDTYYQYVVNFNSMVEAYTILKTEKNKNLNEYEQIFFTHVWDILRSNRTSFDAKNNSLSLLLKKDTSSVDKELLELIQGIQSLLPKIMQLDSQRPLPPFAVNINLPQNLVEDIRIVIRENPVVRKEKSSRHLSRTHSHRHKLDRKKTVCIPSGEIDTVSTQKPINSTIEMKDAENNAVDDIAPTIEVITDILAENKQIISVVEPEHQSNPDSVQIRMKKFNELNQPTGVPDQEICSDDTRTELNDLKEAGSVKKLRQLYNRIDSESKSQSNPDLNLELRGLLSTRSSVRNMASNYDNEVSQQVRALASPHKEKIRVSNMGLFHHDSSRLDKEKCKEQNFKRVSWTI